MEEVSPPDMEKKSPPTGGERFAWADLFKGVAIIFVVLIHVLGRYLSLYRAGSAPWYTVSITHCIVDCAVPCFIFLSAFLNTISLLRRPDPLRFYRSRLQTILLPYLIWSAVYIALQFVIHPDAFTWTKALHQVLVGKAYEHLYFLWILLQLLLIMPWITPLFKKRPPFLMLLGVALALAVVYKAINLLWLLPWPEFNRSALRFIIIISMGMWLGANSQRLRDILSRGLWIILIAAIGGAALSFPSTIQEHQADSLRAVRSREAKLAASAKSQTISNVNQHNNNSIKKALTPVKSLAMTSHKVLAKRPQSIKMRYLRSLRNDIGYWLYTIGAAFLLMTLCSRWKRKDAGTRMMELLGKYSLQIYLVHPIILLTLDYIHIIDLAGKSAAFVCYVTLSLALPVFLAYLLEKIRIAQFIFGRA